MKLKELQKDLERIRKQYPGAGNWDIYIEFEPRVTAKAYRGRGFKVIKDCEKWSFVEQAGWLTWFPDKKIVGININY